MEIGEFQELIRQIYFQRDFRRGAAGTFMWLAEEVGELAQALRSGDRQSQAEEFADCFAWLVSLASIADVEMESAIDKYRGGCPECGETPCRCPEKV